MARRLADLVGQSPLAKWLQTDPRADGGLQSTNLASVRLRSTVEVGPIGTFG